MRLNTRAFAMAGGSLAAAVVFGLTLLGLIAPHAASALGPFSGLLFGHSMSVAGAFVGALWAYAYGFAGGGALAFVYNLALVPPPPLEDEIPPDDPEPGRT